jgi:hypothetical protein
MVARRSICALAVAMGFLAAASSADAATYCVANQPCVDAGGIDKPDIDGALSAAAVAFGTDRIEIGPGTFYTSTGWAYDTAAQQNAVHIVGAGAGQTQLFRYDEAANTYALKLTGKPDSSVSDLSVIHAASSNAYVHDGLDLSGTASRLEVVSTANQGAAARIEADSTLADSTATVSTVNAYGVRLDGNKAILAGSKIDAPKGTGIESGGSGTKFVTRTRVDAHDTVAAFGGATLYLDDSELHPTRLGVWTSGATVHGLNLTIAGSAPAAVGASAHASSTVTLENSILYGVGTALQTKDATATVTARLSDYTAPNDVFAGSALDESDGVQHVDPGFVDAAAGDLRLRGDSPLLDAGTDAPKDGAIALQDLSGNPRLADATAKGVAAPDLGAYEFQPHAPTAAIVAPDSVAVGEAASFSSAGSADPDPGDSLTFRWTIDGEAVDGADVSRSISHAGRVAVSLTVSDRSGLSATASRTVDVLPGPVVAPPGGAGAPPALSGFTINPHRFRAGRHAAFRFKLSESARVRIAITQSGGRLRQSRRTGTLARSAHSGSNRVGFSGRVGKRRLKPGRYVAVVRATDAGGRVSSKRAVKFTILR